MKNLRTFCNVMVLALLCGALAACGGGGGTSGSNQPSSGTGGAGSGNSPPQTIQYQPSPLAVTPNPETGNAATASIGPTGGSVSATDDAGTVYTLQIPPGALMAVTDITLTPLRSVAGLPLSGPDGLGVQISPDGLHLLKSATLSIAPSGGLPASNGLTRVGFGYHGNGDEFYLTAAQVASDGSQATLSLEHFSGYGLSAGSSQEIQDQQDNHPPTATSDWADQENAIPPAVKQAGEYLQSLYLVDQAKVQAGMSNEDFMDEAMMAYVDWKQHYMASPFYGQGGVFLVEDSTLTLNLVDAIAAEVENARVQCADHNLRPIRNLLRWNYLATVYPALMAKIPSNLQKDAAACAHFELDFDSDMKQMTTDGTVEMELTAKVPVGPSDFTNIFGMKLTGQAQSTYKVAHYPQVSNCSVFVDAQGDTFDVENLDLGMNLQTAGTDPSINQPVPILEGMSVTLNPFEPMETVTVICNDGTTRTQNGPYWLGNWTLFHQSELAGLGYKLSDAWIPDFSGTDVLATATYDQTGVGNTSEHTVIKLRHTPQPF